MAFLLKEEGRKKKYTKYVEILSATPSTKSGSYYGIII